MSSLALYRKWRPQSFGDLLGQDIIRDTLDYALKHNQMSQAYLFCGPRGTGKTTTARLVAKLINCTNEGENRPCNSCASCLTITEGTNLDVAEIDAASNRGIDEIRQLRDAVRFAPTVARYKVFIIDEVHMLTREAFNALLKTLEEPPKHTLFILATTESHKIPPTITSRCQRFDFRLATQDILTSHLSWVAKEEGMMLAPEAAAFLARLADGSFRDALSLLDQVRAVKQSAYTLAHVESLFGYVPQEQIEACLTAILRGDYTQAHALIDAALARGADIKAFAGQLLAMSRTSMEALALGDFKAFSPELAKACQTMGLKNLVGWVERLLEALQQMKQSPIARLPLDVAIAKTVIPTVSPSNQSVAIPVMKAAAQVAANAPTETKSEKPSAKAVVTETSSEGQSLPDSRGETVAVPVAIAIENPIEPEAWQSVLKELKREAPSLVTSLAHAKTLGMQDENLQIAVRFKMHADKINQVKNRAKIESVIASVLGRPLKINACVVKELVVEDEVADVAEIFEFEE